MLQVKVIFISSLFYGIIILLFSYFSMIINEIKTKVIVNTECMYFYLEMSVFAFFILFLCHVFSISEQCTPDLPRTLPEEIPLEICVHLTKER